MDDQFFTHCYDAHNFQELNNIDVNMLHRVMLYHNKLFPQAKNGTIFDVGTNAGSFIKVLRQMKINSTIHCFEPHPVLSKATQNIYQNIIMNQMCLSNEDGTVEIHFPKLCIGLSSIIKRPIFDKMGTTGLKKISVPCLKLDTYCKNNNIDKIDFIKIDVEGAEKLIIEGAENKLKNKKIIAGIFEIGETLKDAGTSEQEIGFILEKYGYTIVKNLSRNDWYFHV
jgi:FkbM family methyltransferase